MAAEYTTALIALAGTLFGGSMLELTKRWLNRAKGKDDTQRSLRDEIRVDNADLRRELDKVEAEMIQWREKYFEIWEKYLIIKSKYEEILRQIQRDAEKSIKEVKELVELTPPNTPGP